MGLMRLEAEVQILEPGIEQLWADLQTVPRTVGLVKLRIKKFQGRASFSPL